METEVLPRETGSGVAENWAVAAARLEPKTVMSAPGAMAGRKLAALRMPAELVAGVGRARVKVRALDGPPSPVTVTLAVPLVAMRAAGTPAVNCEALTNLVTS